MRPERFGWTAVGVMSGSSLDGLDLAMCRFERSDGMWTFKVEKAHTMPYTDEFRSRLHMVMHGSALDLARLHRDLGHLIGTACLDLCAGRVVDVIGSHGHTVFHKPEEGLTSQIGCGARIAAVSGVATVNDFRTSDVALGGQGAPLVPLGEQLLFPSNKAFLNIGGICNVSMHTAAGVSGHDVCIGNQALDLLAQEAGLPYDANGDLARSGHVDRDLLHRLNALPFHEKPPPRSLGREWFEQELRPLITGNSISTADRLCTTVEHIAQQVGRACRTAPWPVLVSGGGAHNRYLMQRIAALTRIEVPLAEIIDFKEAIIFALLAILRLQGKATALASVTGARRDNVGGALHLPN